MDNSLDAFIAEMSKIYKTWAVRYPSKIFEALAKVIC